MKPKSVADELVEAVRETAAIVKREAQPAAIQEIPLSTEDAIRPARSLKEHLLCGPKVDNFEIERDRDMGREIKF